MVTQICRIDSYEICHKTISRVELEAKAFRAIAIHSWKKEIVANFLHHTKTKKTEKKNQDKRRQWQKDKGLGENEGTCSRDISFHGREQKKSFIDGVDFDWSSIYFTRISTNWLPVIEFWSSFEMSQMLKHVLFNLSDELYP